MNGTQSYHYMTANLVLVTFFFEICECSQPQLTNRRSSVVNLISAVISHCQNGHQNKMKHVGRFKNVIFHDRQKIT